MSVVVGAQPYDGGTVVIVDDYDTAHVVSVGEQGPAGPPGPPGSGSAGAPGTGDTLTLPAGEAIGGQRAVAAANGQFFYADAANPADGARLIGISTGAAAAGAPATAQTAGTLSDASFAFTPGAPIYLGTAGALTQSPPDSGFALVLGYPITATQLAISRREAVFLAESVT